MPSFQYVSDLHIEFYDGKEHPFDVEACAEYLLLAGDIGNPFVESYRLFLENVSSKFNKIFIIAGNHEYYHNCIDETDEKIRSICSLFNNVIFLQNETYDISENLKIFGTTLWTYIPPEYDCSLRPDYSFIKNCSPSVTNTIHQRSVRALEDEITANPNINYIVLSHHLPSRSLIAQQYRKYENLNHAYATDLNIAKSESIKAWVYGHTHSSSIVDKYYCNPVGYPGENNHWSMNEIFTITI